MMEKRRVVITGLGAVTPLGLNVTDSWAGVRAGKCGIDTITQFDHSSLKCHVAAEVKNFVPEEHLDKREAKRMDRFTQFAMIAAKEAVDSSGLDFAQEDSERCGAVVSAGIGGLITLQEESIKGAGNGFSRISPFFIPTVIGNIAGARIAIQYGLKGMVTCPTTACAGGTNAVGDAMRQIRDGYADIILCGGAEAVISGLGVGGFCSMHALSTAEDPAYASTPFDKERSGFVMGEGAGILVLEELEHAQRRGAAIVAEIVGYGATCDAYHITAPAPGGAGGAACMTACLKDAGVAPEQVDYINAHGTSTPMNDVCETQAVKTAFGAHARKLMISSTKSMTGHMLGAAGAVEAIFTALSLREGYVPATIGYRTPDPECDLDVVPNEGRNAALTYAMSNSLGFGGHNASILLRRWEG